MASGFGTRGTVGRCFEAWQDFAKCMAESDDPFSTCGPYREDYLECLHHKKEFHRLNTIFREAERQQQAANQKQSGNEAHGAH